MLVSLIFAKASEFALLYCKTLKHKIMNKKVKKSQSLQLLLHDFCCATFDEGRMMMMVSYGDHWFVEVRVLHEP